MSVVVGGGGGGGGGGGVALVPGSFSQSKHKLLGMVRIKFSTPSDKVSNGTTTNSISNPENNGHSSATIKPSMEYHSSRFM